MKTYTFYTDSHEILLKNWFIPSFQRYNNIDDLVVKKFEQKSSTGNFMDKGWNETMLDKVYYIIHSIDETSNGNYFVHADCDIQFFKKIEESVEKYLQNDFDIIAQADGASEVCCGFMIIRSGDKVKNLFKDIIDHVKDGKFGNDQIALNALWKKYDIKIQLLPKEFYSIWMTNGKRVWDKTAVNGIPQNLVMHHANFTIGVENKIKLLEIVKRSQ
jgi:hypothetical protein